MFPRFETIREFDRSFTARAEPIPRLEDRLDENGDPEQGHHVEPIRVDEGVWKMKRVEIDR